MSRQVFINIIRFVLLILLQVLVFNNMEIYSFLVPQVYLLFILLLPFETPKWLLLILSFILGLIIDMFNHTIGLHTAACTLVGFVRPWVQNIASAKQEYEPGIMPGIRNLGFKWFLTYSVILVSFHHFLVYFLEEFSFKRIFLVLLYAMVNVLLTTVTVIIVQLLFFRPAK